MLGMGMGNVSESIKQGSRITVSSTDSFSKPIEKQLILQPTRNGNKCIKIQRIHQDKASRFKVKKCLGLWCKHVEYSFGGKRVFAVPSHRHNVKRRRKADPATVFYRELRKKYRQRKRKNEEYLRILFKALFWYRRHIKLKFWEDKKHQKLRKLSLYQNNTAKVHVLKSGAVKKEEAPTPPISNTTSVLNASKTESKDTLEEILEILTELSTSSSPEYVAVIEQMLSQLNVKKPSTTGSKNTVVETADTAPPSTEPDMKTATPSSITESESKCIPCNSEMKNKSNIILDINDNMITDINVIKSNNNNNSNGNSEAVTLKTSSDTGTTKLDEKVVISTIPVPLEAFPTHSERPVDVAKTSVQTAYTETISSSRSLDPQKEWLQNLQMSKETTELLKEVIVQSTALEQTSNCGKPNDMNCSFGNGNVEVQSQPQTTYSSVPPNITVVGCKMVPINENFTSETRPIINISMSSMVDSPVPASASRGAPTPSTGKSSTEPSLLQHIQKIESILHLLRDRESSNSASSAAATTSDLLCTCSSVGPSRYCSVHRTKALNFDTTNHSSTQAAITSPPPYSARGGVVVGDSMSGDTNTSALCKCTSFHVSPLCHVHYHPHLTNNFQQQQENQNYVNIPYNDGPPKPRQQCKRRKYLYRGSKKPYRYIPEVFKDSNLPSNEETIFGRTTTITDDLTHRRKRTPSLLNGATKRATMRSRQHSKPRHKAKQDDDEEDPALECPPSNGSAPIDLVPVNGNMSTTSMNNQGSKLMKAVPIGNGLYRLEYPDENEINSGSLSKPVYQANMSMFTTPPPSSRSTVPPPKTPVTLPQYQISINKASPNIIEYRPKASDSLETMLSPLISSSSSVTRVTPSSVPFSSASIPSVVYQAPSYPDGSKDDTAEAVTETTSILSSSLVSNIIDNILAESTSDPNSRIVREALSLGIPRNL